MVQQKSTYCTEPQHSWKVSLTNQTLKNETTLCTKSRKDSTDRL